MSTPSREWSLIARPHGEPTPSDFEFKTIELEAPGPGEVLVRNTWISVDPYMRGRMNDAKSYVPKFELGETMLGGAVGVVEQSNVEGIAVGDTVEHLSGWREYAIVPAKEARVVDAAVVSPEAYLGVLGMPGLTAYAGLKAVAQVREGDVVFISGAAGAVGSVAGQLARELGAARVIGSAGGPAKKQALLERFGFDAAIDYREGNIRRQLREAAPEGIDVYFDNVGGEHLEAAISCLNPHGRAVLCGAIADYNATEAPTGPNNLALAIGKRLRLEGFIVFDHMKLTPEYHELAIRMLQAGTLTTDQTVVEGIDNALDAFLSLMHGGNTGKMLVRL